MPSRPPPTVSPDTTSSKASPARVERAAAKVTAKARPITITRSRTRATLSTENSRRTMASGPRGGDMKRPIGTLRVLGQLRIFADSTLISWRALHIHRVKRAHGSQHHPQGPHRLVRQQLQHRLIQTMQVQTPQSCRATPSSGPTQPITPCTVLWQTLWRQRNS